MGHILPLLPRLCDLGLNFVGGAIISLPIGTLFDDRLLIHCRKHILTPCKDNVNDLGHDFMT